MIKIPRPRLATREMLDRDTTDELMAVRIHGLNHTFGEGELKKQVLFENTLELTRGEIVIMTGPSGSGKTTLLTLIGGLRTVQEGSLQVIGREMNGLDASQLVEVRRHIGFIFQAHNLFPSLSSFQNVRMALELGNHTTGEMKDRIEEMLTTLGLGHRIHYKPQQLSGGQRQRVAIARALVSEPDLVLADEPTAALDKQSGRDVVDLLKRFAKEKQCTILLVTHDNRILDVADRIVNMVDGHVISDVVVRSAAIVCDFLRIVPLFREMTPQTLSEVADQVTIEKVPAGQEIVRQGDPGDKFYLIRHGSADVLVRGDDGARKVATLTEGHFFGEAALLTGEPRNATVRAADDMELYTLGKEDFDVALASSAPFAEELRKVWFERQ